LSEFDANLTDIWYGNEIEVSIGYLQDDGEDNLEWEYETIEYRQGFNPDMPEDSEAVYDGLSYMGEKRIIADNEVELSQLFRGFNKGLEKFENMKGLLVKAEIIPDGGDVPIEADDTMYLTNVNTFTADLDDIPNEGEFEISLSGRFDEKVFEEPETDEDWVPEEEHDVNS